MTGEHTDVAAYSLGLLEEQDRQAFEDHLAGCPQCAAELAELSSMSALLAGVEPAGPAGQRPGGGEVTDLLRRRATAQHRRTRRQVILAAAAAIVLLAGGLAAGLAAASPPAAPGPGPPRGAVALSHTDPRTGVTGTVHLVAKAWGTQVWLDLSKVHGPLECQLVAVAKTGQRRVVTGWFVPRPGDGVPGHPKHLTVQGGTSIRPGELSSFLVTVLNGPTILTIPA